MYALLAGYRFDELPRAYERETGAQEPAEQHQEICKNARPKMSSINKDSGKNSLERHRDTKQLQQKWIEK
jgi:hypothetical protein